MSLGNVRGSARGMSLFKKTEKAEKQNATLNVSFDINERNFLKAWAKKEQHSMAVIIKKALKEYYLRHEMEVEENVNKRLEKEQLKKQKRTK